MKIAERLLLILDTVTVATIFLGSFYIRFWTGWFDTYLHTRETHYLFALPIILLIQMGCLWFLRGYSIRRPCSYPAQLVTVFHAAVMTALFFLALVFWYRAWSFSRWVMVLYVVIMTGVLPLLRVGFFSVLFAIRRAGYETAPLLAICSADRDAEVRALVESHTELGYRMGRTLHVEDVDGERHPALYNLMGESGARDVYLSIPPTFGRLAVELVEQAKEEAISVHIHPVMYHQIRSHPRWRVIDDGIWYTLERSAWDRLYQNVKRAMDIGIASGILLATLPLQALIALCVRWREPGPAIFSQLRAGLNGRPFTIYKFRSMSVDAEERLEDVLDVEGMDQPVFKVANDPRVTPIGRFLRRFSLDELPQLYNVIRGDMSLVGPRPEETWVTERYDDRTRQRLRLKPGITGYQQIRARGTDDMEVRLNHDLYYLDHQSLVFDLYILVQTSWVVFWGKGQT